MKRLCMDCRGGRRIAVGATVMAQSVPRLNYRGERRHLTLPAYGEVAGVATNSQRQHLRLRAHRPRRSRRSATSARSITAARACFSSIRPASS